MRTFVSVLKRTGAANHRTASRTVVSVIQRVASSGPANAQRRNSSTSTRTATTTTTATRIANAPMNIAHAPVAAKTSSNYSFGTYAFAKLASAFRVVSAASAANAVALPEAAYHLRKSQRALLLAGLIPFLFIDG
eukprot:GEZU01009415.1.p1 GENE.GEZU01009415.1~~GEZU01009415.1.p1  ORF type:complete len:148 (-),score=11.49 GEZU01009415.1:372-776(-)